MAHPKEKRTTKQKIFRTTAPFEYYIPVVLYIFVFEFISIEQNVSTGHLSVDYMFFPYPTNFLILLSWLGSTIFTVFLIFVSWHYRSDFYSMALPLKVVFRSRRYWYSLFIVAVLFFVIGSFITYEPMAYPLFLFGNGVVFLLLLLIPTLFMVNMVRLSVYLFSPGVKQRFSNLIHMKYPIVSLIGSEASEVLQYANEFEFLSMRYESYLIAEVHAGLSEVLKKEFPRMTVQGIDSALVDLLLTMRMGKEKELDAASYFFKRMKTLLSGSNGEYIYSNVNDILNELESLMTKLERIDLFRQKSGITGYWNIRMRERVKPFDSLVTLVFSILIVLFTVLFGLHILP